MPQSATSGLKIDTRGAFGVFRRARTGKKKKKKKIVHYPVDTFPETSPHKTEKKKYTK